MTKLANLAKTNLSKLIKKTQEGEEVIIGKAGKPVAKLIEYFDRLTLQKDHKDPFDRMLISQAKADNLTLITADPKIFRSKLSLFKA